MGAATAAALSPAMSKLLSVTSLNLSGAASRVCRVRGVFVCVVTRAVIRKQSGRGRGHGSACSSSGQRCVDGLAPGQYGWRGAGAPCAAEALTTGACLSDNDIGADGAAGIALACDKLPSITSLNLSCACLRGQLHAYLGEGHVHGSCGLGGAVWHTGNRLGDEGAVAALVPGLEKLLSLVSLNIGRTFAYRLCARAP